MESSLKIFHSLFLLKFAKLINLLSATKTSRKMIPADEALRRTTFLWVVLKLLNTFPSLHLVSSLHPGDAQIHAETLLFLLHETTTATLTFVLLRRCLYHLLLYLLFSRDFQSINATTKFFKILHG